MEDGFYWFWDSQFERRWEPAEVRNGRIWVINDEGSFDLEAHKEHLGPRLEPPLSRAD